MDLNTLFLAIIAFCMIIIVITLIVFLFSVVRTLNSTSEKLAVVAFELSQILPSIRQSAKNIESATSLFGIINLFRSKKE